MFKVALNAGHYKNEPGKRVLKTLDKNETREWVLNDRICDKVEKNLAKYDGVSLIRIDDTTGKTNVTLANRAKKANDFNANVYISVHHNAGINGGKGGGISTYVYTKVDDYTRKVQRLLYNKLIEKTSLKGNRASPIETANFAELRLTRMAAVLLELGFMDSVTDVPIILSEDYADKCALAITEAIVELGGLKLKEQPKSQTLYLVQTGAYANKKNAEQQVEKLKKAGFDAIIKTETK